MTAPTFRDATRQAPVLLPDGREGTLWSVAARHGYCTARVGSEPPERFALADVRLAEEGRP